MADIELIIKIPEEEYINIKDAINSLIENGVERASMSKVCLAILDGTPLPKGHGRITDIDKVIKKMEEREEKLKDDRSIWETAGVETALDMFGETIIEADKTESEE